MLPHISCKTEIMAKQNKRIYVKISESIKELFKMKCEQEETTMSEVIKDKINDYIKDGNNKNK
jgi:hypothetical protein